MQKIWNFTKAKVHAMRATRAEQKGDHDTAVNILRRSVELWPYSRKTLLKLALVSDITGDFTSAANAYLQALILNQQDAEAHMLLNKLKESLGRNKKVHNERDIALKPVLFIDIGDFIDFIRTDIRITGIQRVIIGLLTELVNITSHNKYKIEFSCFDPVGRGLVVLPSHHIKNIMSDILSADAKNKNIRQQIITMSKQSVPISVYSGDVFISIGAFWIVKNYSDKIEYLKQNGVLIGAYIYDLISITHPHYFGKQVANHFEQALIKLVPQADFFLTISAHVAAEMTVFCERVAQYKIPISPVLLPHQMSQSIFKDKNIVVSSEVQQILSRKYVLCVCTIEARKNHILLYKIWCKLLEKYGVQNTPILVLVGKWGWLAAEFQHAMKQSKNLDGKIIILNTINNLELTKLYQNTIFTIFPSFVEGWGLPIGESTSFGRLCLASNTSSMPEVVGSFADYFNPHDFADAYSKTEKLILDEAYLAKRTKEISSNFKPKEWSEFAIEFLSEIEKSAA